MSQRLADRVAIVTGAAHGIGQAIATRFATEGAVVVIADIDRERSAAHAARIGGHFVATDVSDEAAVRALMEETEQRFERLDILVSNACIYRGGTAESTTLDAWNALLAVNLTASYLLARHAAPLLRRQTGASIVVLASVQALVGFGGDSAYATAKGGLLAFMRQLAVDLAPAVRVNAISPGTIRSYPERADPDGEARLARLHLLGRIGECDEVAAAAAFLASADASFITGHNLVVDGGLTARGE